MAKGGKGGFKGALASGITMVLIIGAIVAWGRVNNINSYTSFRDYFKGWSDAINDCGYIKWISGKCSDRGGGSGEGDSLSPGSSHGGGTLFPEGNGSITGGANEEGEGISPELPIDDFKTMLQNLEIRESDFDAPYDRSEWKHWMGSPCNTRQQVLLNQGTKVVKDESAKCKVLSGLWTDPYSLVEFTAPGDLDIDHVVPLSWANRNGATAWEKEKKQSFANDFDHLLAVSAKENRSKGDKGPSEYMPPNKKYHCDYSKIWIFTLDKYDLTLPQEDADALEKGLATCR